MSLVDHKVALKIRCFLFNSRQTMTKLGLGYVFMSKVYVLNLAVQGPTIHFHFVQAKSHNPESLN